MERAYPNFGRIAGNAKPILMFRFLVMHTHLIGSHHDKHKLTGRIIHRPAPPASARERVSIVGVKVRLTRRVFRFFRLYLLLLLSYRPSGHFQIGSSQ
jgi:hypothetical protein